MSNPTTDMLIEMLKTTEVHRQAIDEIIASDRPDTSDQLLILRTLQQSFVSHSGALRKAVREFN
jgi:hypothetical protein